MPLRAFHRRGLFTSCIGAMQKRISTPTRLRRVRATPWLLRISTLGTTHALPHQAWLHRSSHPLTPPISNSIRPTHCIPVATFRRQQCSAISHSHRRRSRPRRAAHRMSLNSLRSRRLQWQHGFNGVSLLFRWRTSLGISHNRATRALLTELRLHARYSSSVRQNNRRLRCLFRMRSKPPFSSRTTGIALRDSRQRTSTSHRTMSRTQCAFCRQDSRSRRALGLARLPHMSEAAVAGAPTRRSLPYSVQRCVWLAILPLWRRSRARHLLSLPINSHLLRAPSLRVRLWFAS